MPTRGVAYTTYVWLVSQADGNLFQTSVTLAAGDVQVSKDGGAFVNIATLPVEIGTSGCLEVALSATEMTADTVAVRFRDAAGSEWADLSFVEHTTAVTEIADAVLKRGVDNTEATADNASLTELILAAFESKIATTTWTIYKTNHSDTFNTRTVTLDASADPITEVT